MSRGPAVFGVHYSDASHRMSYALRLVMLVSYLTNHADASSKVFLSSQSIDVVSLKAAGRTTSQSPFKVPELVGSAAYKVAKEVGELLSSPSVSFLSGEVQHPLWIPASAQEAQAAITAQAVQKLRNGIEASSRSILDWTRENQNLTSETQLEYDDSVHEVKRLRHTLAAYEEGTWDTPIGRRMRQLEKEEDDLEQDVILDERMSDPVVEERKTAYSREGKLVKIANPSKSQAVHASFGTNARIPSKYDGYRAAERALDHLSTSSLHMYLGDWSTAKNIREPPKDASVHEFPQQFNASLSVVDHVASKALNLSLESFRAVPEPTTLARHMAVANVSQIHWDKTVAQKKKYEAGSGQQFPPSRLHVHTSSLPGLLHRSKDLKYEVTAKSISSHKLLDLEKTQLRTPIYKSLIHTYNQQKHASVSHGNRDSTEPTTAHPLVKANISEQMNSSGLTNVHGATGHGHEEFVPSDRPKNPSNEKRALAEEEMLADVEKYLAKPDPFVLHNSSSALDMGATELSHQNQSGIETSSDANTYKSLLSHHQEHTIPSLEDIDISTNSESSEVSNSLKSMDSQAALDHAAFNEPRSEWKDQELPTEESTIASVSQDFLKKNVFGNYWPSDNGALWNRSNVVKDDGASESVPAYRSGSDAPNNDFHTLAYKSLPRQGVDLVVKTEITLRPSLETSRSASLTPAGSVSVQDALTREKRVTSMAPHSEDASGEEMLIAAVDQYLRKPDAQVHRSSGSKSRLLTITSNTNQLHTFAVSPPSEVDHAKQPSTDSQPVLISDNLRLFLGLGQPFIDMPEA